ncbi:MAG: hypothetical protein D6683_14525 [Actinomyces sp.]|nr:MAG: hypothetical protein D6683_14525 [Actinomyces sp.]
MTLRLVGVATLLAWVGLTLVLAEVPWFRRASLADRLAPHLPGAGRRGRSWTVADLGAVCAPLLTRAGDTLAAGLGIDEPLSVRLERAHDRRSDLEVRLRQVALALVALLAGSATAVALGAPGALAAVVVLVPPVLAVLWVEHGVTRAATAWQEQLFGELPVVAEQIGTLLGAGWSLSGALERVAVRGGGACAADLALVVARLRHGLDEHAALREWAERARVDAVDRLVSVLALERDTADLSALVAAEARHARQEAHRRTIEAIERRNQQVWIPVTVAALVPGVLLMAVPFVDALSVFAA